MKKSMIGAVALFALTSMGAAVAAPQDPSVQISASSSYRMNVTEFDEYAHRYALDNGRHVMFSRSVGRYYVQLKDEGRAELYAVAPRSFVTAAGTRVEFAAEGESVTISNYEKLPMKVAMTQTNVVMLAQR